jgi:glycosyltransferase involved in cell wall biosynthesis
MVSAVHNVEKYLPQFIASIESQRYPLDRVQVIMVDDGSTDSSSRILADWQARRPELVTVVTQINGGVGSARNTGIGHVRGEWVTFPDPDDLLAPTYLVEVEAFLEDHPAVAMVATRRRIFLEASGALMDHPLQAHFATPNRARNLDEHPEFFHGAVNSAFFRTEIIRRERLQFDERIRPHFEDGHFCVAYLLRVPRPTVAFVSTAEYTYRKRADKTSVLDTSRADPRRFTTVLEHGFLDILRQAHARRGRVPDWVQSFILYELSWYFKDEDAAASMPSAAFGDVAAEFHRLLAAIVGFLSPSVVSSFRLRPFDPVWREVLLHAYDPVPWHSGHARVDKLDTRQGLVRITYRYTHTRPDEEFLSSGVVVEPAFAKSRSVMYFDRAVLHERIVWLPAGAVRVVLGGTVVDVRLREPERPTHTLPWGVIRETLTPRMVARRRERARTAARRQPLKPAERLLVRLARTKMVRRRFANAWVLIDRTDRADDSAEILFRHLRKHRRKVNAWFVIHKDASDHRRLREDGYRRVIPYGSVRWKLLMLNCRHLVSSHVDPAICRPPAITRLGPPTWRFTFLQHGVIRDDLSRWLNPEDFDLLVTSTPAEHASIVADGTPYRYTARETKLTGLPRFDAVLQAGRLVPPDRRDLILVAPTSRRWLTDLGPERSALEVGEFVTTEFGTRWLGLVGASELGTLAEQRGLRVALLLHPDLEALGAGLDLPEHVEVLGFHGQDMRSLLARARVLVTDYSSTAFDAAYIDRPVVYFQFDRKRMSSGAHLGRRGYFDYGRDGYGPVADTHEEAVRAIVDAVELGPHPRPEFAARIAQAFPQRDGGCCERVFKEIRASTRRFQ